MPGLCGVELPQNNATAIFFYSVAHFVAYITPECRFRYHCVTRHWAVFSLYFCYTADKLEYNKKFARNLARKTRSVIRVPLYYSAHYLIPLPLKERKKKIPIRK